jgi:hypothetical protein
MTDDLAELDAIIASAMAALHGARAVANRSPNAETVRLEMVAAERVDFLLDKRLRLMQREAVTA